ncbi:HlyD family secretion protein [Bradyrhizobium lablabi]|uniref:efflux RND transporter periplasmic adaptor subunit n=1 Tax=Bradyrhizobium lablabi TaxID=722472 RepID=UPI001BA5F9D5|nr:HlyD family secretion protein [Bradyrhizobium lablabi]MBR0692195.1 HlyD family secretion protein [Bradyrhizobium lablabi]
MTVTEIISKQGKRPDHREQSPFLAPETDEFARRRIKVIPFLITLATVALAGLLGWAMWRVYMEAPWTRDATVRAYVVTIAPEVSGRIVELPVADNQFVHKGDLLMVVDPTNFAIAARLADAAVDQAQALAQNARAQSERRQKLTDLAISQEEQQTFSSNSLSADAAYQQALAKRDQAHVDLERTRIVSPVNGYVTNLQVQLGDFVTVGQRSISLVNTDSFWVDAYFEETNLRGIREGDLASIKLMGHGEVVRGHVESVARGIDIPNTQPDTSGLASVNPIFTWVRLAQRIPVRIHLDDVPSDVRLVAGLTATVQIEPGSAKRSHH